MPMGTYKGRWYWCPKCGAKFRKIPGKGRVCCPRKECGNSRCYRSAIGGGAHSRTLYRLRYNEKHGKTKKEKPPMTKRGNTRGNTRISLDRYGYLIYDPAIIHMLPCFTCRGLKTVSHWWKESEHATASSDDYYCDLSEKKTIVPLPEFWGHPHFDKPMKAGRFQ